MPKELEGASFSVQKTGLIAQSNHSQGRVMEERPGWLWAILLWLMRPNVFIISLLPAVIVWRIKGLVFVVAPLLHFVLSKATVAWHDRLLSLMCNT